MLQRWLLWRRAGVGGRRVVGSGDGNFKSDCAGGDGSEFVAQEGQRGEQTHCGKNVVAGKAPTTQAGCDAADRKGFLSAAVAKDAAVGAGA